MSKVWLISHYIYCVIISYHDQYEYMLCLFFVQYFDDLSDQRNEFFFCDTEGFWLNFLESFPMQGKKLYVR